MGRKLLIGLLICFAALAGAASANAAEATTTVSLVRVKFDRHHGTATVLAKVSGPGTLTLSGGKVIRRSVDTSGAGIAKLKVASKGGALATLAKTHEVEVRIRVTFVASEGARASATRKITLRRARAGSR